MLRVILFSVFAIVVQTCSAGLVITPSNPSPNPIIAGSSGTIDFFIRTDSGTQVLDGFQATVSITGAPAGGLIFSNAQADSQLSDPNYVFFGKSLSQNTSVAIGTVTNAGQTFIGADSTDDGSGAGSAGNPVPVTVTTTDKLLFRLNLTGVSAGSYTLTINPSTASTAFYTDQLDPANTIISNPALTAGQVNVVITAVPEPGSIALLAVAGSSLLLVRRKRSP